MPSPIEEPPLKQIQTGTPTFQTVRPQRRRYLAWLFLGLFGMLCGCSFYLDEHAIDFIEAFRSPGLDAAAVTISYFGDWPYLMLYALLFLLWAWWKKRRALLRLVLAAVLSSSAAGLAANALKHTTGRSRPNNMVAEAGWHGMRHEGQWIMANNGFNSFPSGHTATAFGYFSVLAFRKKPGSFLWFLPAVMIAGSRMVIVAHHLSDVCVGMWFGLLAAWLLGSSRRFATCRLWKVG